MPRSPGIDRHMVFGEAAALVDARGLDHVTLANVAQRLNVRVPSRYNHIESANDLQRQLALFALRAQTRSFKRTHRPPCPSHRRHARHRRTITQRLLDAGAKVVVVARTRNDDTPAEATFVPGDVTTNEGVETIATKTLAALGGLDILVNNAGGGSAFLEGSWTIPDKAWHENLELNLFAAIRLTNAVLPALRTSKDAAVVNISSAAATVPFGAFAHYGAAKAALNAYSRTLAVELAPSGIRVNVVSPGVISTPGSDEFSKAHPEFAAADWLRSIPLGRIGAPEDIAEAVALLVSDRAKFITGANYRVDGGMTAA